MTYWPRRVRDYQGATMTTLSDWLLAQIAEDEERARARSVIPADRGFHSGACELLWVADYLDPECTCNMGERMLAECEAKRRIVELHVPDRCLENWYWTHRKCAECGGLWHKITPFAKPTDIGPEQGCSTLRLLALPYADRPGYREEWRP